MKQIKEFKNLFEVQAFLRECQKEFTLTNLEPFVVLMEPTYYWYEVFVEQRVEGSYGRPSTITLQMEGGASPEYYCKLVFEWWTSSGHVVRIEGCIYDFYTGAGTFTLFLGDDESEVFYPCIVAIANNKPLCAECYK